MGHEFINPNVDILLKGEEATLYLNFLEKGGIDSISKHIENLNEMREFSKTKLIKLEKEYQAERSLNADIKANLGQLSANLPFVRHLKHAGTLESYLREFMYLAESTRYRKDLRLEDVLTHFGSIIDFEVKKKVAKETKKLTDEFDAMKHFNDYQNIKKFKEWKRSFWRTKFPKLFGAKD